MRDWQETTLDQAVQINPSVKIQSGTNSPFVDMKQVEPGHKFVRAAEWRSYTGGGSKFISGDTLMARITPCLENGKIGQYRSDDGLPTNGSTEFIVFRGKPGSTDNEFTYYLITSPDVRNFSIGQMTGTSGRQRVPTDCFSKLTINLPPLSEQKAIAAVLGALDDKIELNRRMNVTLEAMARALFKSWFVDFDPVRAKMEGKQPFGMDTATASLFPSRLIPSPLGDIPEGWDMSKFSDLFDVIGGGTPKTSVEEYWNGDIPWFSVVDAPSDSDVFVLKTDKSITQKGVDESSTKVLPIGTTIISARGTVGRLALVGQPMAMNQSCYGLSPAKGIGASFLYFSTKKAVAELQSHAHGSVFDTITRDTFDGISVIKPSADVVSAFEAMVWPLLEKIKDSLAENIKLEKTRDYLLPKLISGDIRIPDAEKFVEAA